MKYILLIFINSLSITLFAQNETTYRVLQISLPVLDKESNDMNQFGWYAISKYESSQDGEANALLGVMMKEIQDNPKYKWDCDRFLLGAERYKSYGGGFRAQRGVKRYSLSEAQQILKETMNANKASGENYGTKVIQFIVELPDIPYNEWSKYYEFIGFSSVRDNCEN